MFHSIEKYCKSISCHADCSLLSGAMSIKENIFYSKSTGKYEGYINYGKDIVVADEDVVAKEASCINAGKSSRSLEISCWLCID